MPNMTGYLAPHTVFIKRRIPPQNMEPPFKSEDIASWMLNFLGYLVPHAKYPRICVHHAKYPGIRAPHAKYPRISGTQAKYSECKH